MFYRIGLIVQSFDVIPESFIFSQLCYAWQNSQREISFSSTQGQQN